MIRIFIETRVRDFGDVRTGMYSVDINAPELEAALVNRKGGGPDNDDFEIHKVVGAQIVKREQ